MHLCEWNFLIKMVWFENSNIFINIKFEPIIYVVFLFHENVCRILTVCPINLLQSTPIKGGIKMKYNSML